MANNSTIVLKNDTNHCKKRRENKLNFQKNKNKKRKEAERKQTMVIKWDLSEPLA